MEMRVVLNRQELNNLQFPVMVEMWGKVQGSMSKKRKYNETFTEQERATIRRYHAIFHNWHLVKGTPDQYMMNLTTYDLIQRALNFFGTI